jgi:hypothetical protein
MSVDLNHWTNTQAWYRSLVTRAAAREQRPLAVLEEAAQRSPENRWALRLIRKKTYELLPRFLGKRHG